MPKAKVIFHGKRLSRQGQARLQDGRQCLQRKEQFNYVHQRPSRRRSSWTGAHERAGCGSRRITCSTLPAEPLLRCWVERQMAWISWKRADGQTLNQVKRVSRHDQRLPLLDDVEEA